MTAKSSAMPGTPDVAIPRKWTAADIPDLAGRVAVVTGGNGGLGYQTALELARHGARVTLACRNTDKAAAAATAIKGEAPGATVQVASLDLADLRSVRAFADSPADVGPIDLLINNAGVMATPHRTTADGFELQFGTNHLGHFALTSLLLPRLLAAPQPRVVSLSSTLHAYGSINFDDLNSERGYSRYGAYFQAKLAVLLFGLELDRRARKAGSCLTSVIAHPGYAATSLQSAGIGIAPLRAVVNASNKVFAVSPRQGALPTLCASTLPGLPGGSFIGPAKLGGYRGTPGYNTPSKRALDPDTAARLWVASEQATQIPFAFPAP